MDHDTLADMTRHFTEFDATGDEAQFDYVFAYLTELGATAADCRWLATQAPTVFDGPQAPGWARLYRKAAKRMDAAK